jgi:4,5-DOPA dioxygenase extradiol
LPAIYLSHGGGPLPLEDDTWLEPLWLWARSIPKPRAILIVSAHWEAAPLMLSASGPATPLVYDFGGFDPMYYQVGYATPDASWLARRVVASLPAGERPHEHPSRGLDHGAWVPLKAMYPAADVPVLQLSIPTHDPDRLLAIGARLAALRAEGVLIVGSGFMTHGLPFITRDMLERGEVPSWSAEFDAWVAEALARGDLEELTHYTSRAPGLRYAHPTVEHFVPIFVTLGASTNPESTVETKMDGFWMGLAKRSFQAA